MTNSPLRKSFVHETWARLAEPLILGLIFGIATSGAAYSADRAKGTAVDAEFLAKDVEPKIQLPKTAYALNTYKRYYAVECTAVGTEDIVGTFIHDPVTPGILIVDIPRQRFFSATI